jgi:hypothetical protein
VEPQTVEPKNLELQGRVTIFLALFLALVLGRLFL